MNEYELTGYDADIEGRAARQGFWMAVDRALTNGPGLDEYARVNGLEPLYWMFGGACLSGQANVHLDDHEAARVVQVWADHLKLLPIDDPMEGTAEYASPGLSTKVVVWGVVDRIAFRRREKELNEEARNSTEEEGTSI